MGKPKVAILLDENTSGDGTRYEAAKSYFQAIADAGGVPFGMPYLSQNIVTALDEFDGLLTCGGRFAYPADWYIGDQNATTPHSDRFDVEKSLVAGFLDRDKPVLGMCAGMQMLACLQGCKLTPDLRVTYPDALEHDKKGTRHNVNVLPETMLENIIGTPRLTVNSYHQEAVAELSGDIVVSGRSDDDIVEAIELPGMKFALGLQWHQEKFVGTNHVGNQIFKHFVQAM